MKDFVADEPLEKVLGGDLGLTRPFHGLGEEVPPLFGNKAVLDKLLTAPNQQNSDQKAVKPLEPVDDGELNVLIIERTDFACPAQRRYLALWHRRAVNEVADESSVYRIGQMIERRTLKKVVLDRELLDVNAERLPRMSDLALRFWVVELVPDAGYGSRRRQDRRETGILRLSYQF